MDWTHTFEARWNKRDALVTLDLEDRLIVFGLQDVIASAKISRLDLLHNYEEAAETLARLKYAGGLISPRPIMIQPHRNP